MQKKLFIYFFILLITIFLCWYFFIALKPIEIPQQEIISTYQYSPTSLDSFELKQSSKNTFEITFKSFDGSVVNGRISYPEDYQLENKKSYPVFVGVSAMGRNYQRWWVDSFKGRATVTHVNKLGEVALENGHALVAIDARYHGSRKKPERSLRSIMNDLYFFGDKTTYEEMIINTVKDYRILLDWLEKQKNIDSENITMTGYSMGAQVSLLTASIDKRIKNVITIVPPYLDNKVALVAPKNIVSLIDNANLLLITAVDDENASTKENNLLFNQITTTKKQHIIFKGSHILPIEYIDTVQKWLSNL